MVFAARDYFEVGRTPPSETSAPSEGVVFDYLVDRLFDSFDLPLGPVRYLELMNPSFPDGETWLSRLGLAPHGRAWQMWKIEWPRVKGDIDNGHPSPLGLVLARSSNPFDLKLNHQVLAFGYDWLGASLTLHLYDPNNPGRDDVVMSVQLTDPASDLPALSPSGSTLFAFFRVPYERAAPP
jgi:hypothetical protein